jgi:FkbM family methyltransferase
MITPNRFVELESIESKKILLVNDAFHGKINNLKSHDIIIFCETLHPLLDEDIENICQKYADRFIVIIATRQISKEFETKYNCKIIVVDPTPRAIKHYDEIINNQGKAKSKSYVEGGKQSIHSYDLSNVNKDNFILISKALYDIDNKELKFFAPPNKKHVSYSLNNWQNNYYGTEDYIIIKTITVKSIQDKFNIENLEMIKLDIEGAATEVILSMLEHKIFPKQILVEFDELNKVTEISLRRFFDSHYKILSNDYKLVKTSSVFPNFLYIKS